MRARRIFETGLLSITVLALGAPSCGPKPPPKRPSPEPFADRCDEASITQQPDLMGMSMDFRANIAATRQQGVLAVRYAAKDCEIVLEVLPNCVGTGTYAFSAYPGNESKLASNKLELFAKLPLGAATLEGKLAQGRTLRTDYKFAGMLTLPIGQPFERAGLRGQDCDRATHIVNRIYVGGFALAVGETRQISTAATIFGAGLGFGQDKTGEMIASEGIADECTAAQAKGELSTQCQAPLRLGLLALSNPDPAAYKPDDEGFVPLLVVDDHNCRANEEVWNGTRCESLTAKPTVSDTFFRDDHGCVMGKEVWFAKEQRCVDGEGHEILDSLRLKPAEDPK